MKKAGEYSVLILVLAMVFSLFDIPVYASSGESDMTVAPVQYRFTVDGGAETSLWAYEIGTAAYFRLRDIAAVLNGTEKQFDIYWIPEYREVDLSEGYAYTPVGGEFSKPEHTENVVAEFTDCSIRSHQDWGNILSYLIDGSHYVKLSDLAAVIGFSLECNMEARTAWIDTSPEAGAAAYTGEAFDNIALMDAGNAYFIDDDGTVIIRYADGTEAEAPMTLGPAESVTWSGWSVREAGFYISKAKTAVSYCEDDGFVRVATSEDMGETWEKSEVIARNVGINQMYLGFNTPNDGWLVICNFHGMGAESHYIYRTSDGGKTWTQTGNPNDLYARVLTGAGFATGNIGFLCFRFETDFSPAVCRTMDGGLTWEKVSVEVPEEFGAYYSETPLSPVFDGADGVLPVELKNNAGDTITIYFITDNYGETWAYSLE